MGAKLQTVLGSWRVWVTVGCIVYIGLIRGQGPRIAAIWPWGVEVATGLLLLALLFVAWIVSDVLARYVLVPFFTLLEGKKIADRTAKAKEKLADSLISFSTAVLSAVCISLLVYPFTAFIQTMARGIDSVEALMSWWQSVGGSLMGPAWWSGWHTVLILVCYWVPLSIGLLFRRRALDIYDAIAPSTPVVAPTARGTHEQLTFPDPGPPVYVRANEGSRRRRRHRTK